MIISCLFPLDRLRGGDLYQGEEGEGEIMQGGQLCQVDFVAYAIVAHSYLATCGCSAAETLLTAMICRWQWVVPHAKT